MSDPTASVHICAPGATMRRIQTCVCPDCTRRTRMLQFFTPWYGWNQTCLRCGRRWCDGEWMSLPFYRDARADSIRDAKRQWRRGVVADDAL